MCELSSLTFLVYVQVAAQSHAISLTGLLVVYKLTLRSGVPYYYWFFFLRQSISQLIFGGEIIL